MRGEWCDEDVSGVMREVCGVMCEVSGVMCKVRSGVTCEVRCVR